MNKRGLPKKLLGGGVVVFVLAGLMIVWFHRSGLLFAIPRYLRAAGWWGIGISYGLVVLQSIIPYAPFALIAGFNTSAHGFWLGYLVSFAGVLTGNLLLYGFARRIVVLFFKGKQEQLWQRYPKLEVIRRKVVNARFWSAFSILFILRIQPWVPSSLLDLLSGVTGVKFSPFFFSTVAGQAPSVAAMTYLGHRLMNLQKYKKEIIMFVGLAIVLGIIYYLWRYGRKHQILRRLRRLINSE